MNSPKYEEFMHEQGVLAFVEQAKLLLEENEIEQAIAVCREGIEAHPKSIVGRVLWGKALVRLGRPADAMHEFEAAIALDRENPRAYGLVAEVFLETRLFRSALPMLRKACSLEPENANFKLYLDYTQKALAGEALPEFISLLSWTELEEHIPEPPPVEEDGPTQSLEPDEDGPTQSFKIESEGDEAEGEGAGGEEAVSAAQWEDNGRGGFVARIPQRAAPKEAVAPTVSQEFGRVSKSVTLSMLDALPDLPEEPEPVVLSAAAHAHAAEREGQAYESELKAALEAREKRKTFWKKWGSGARGAAVLSVVVAAVAGTVVWAAYNLTGKKQERISNHLVEARRSMNADLRESYKLALASLKRALSMEGGNTEAWALTALAYARQFQSFGGEEEARLAAIKALEQDGVRRDYPKIALLVDAIAGAPAVREKAVKEILESRDLPSDAQNPDSRSLDIQSSDIQSEAGWLLLAQGKAENAATRFEHATKLFASNIRAWIGLAETYLAMEEEDSAYQALNVPALTDNAAEHPLRILGLARARLALNKELEKSLREVKFLTLESGLPNDRRMQRERTYGLLLSAAGNEEEAIEILEKGKQFFEAHAFEFGLDLGDVYLRAGQVLSAQKQFEEAIEQKPNALEAKEKLAKVLIARERADEILEKIRPDSNELIFARAWALARRGEWKKLQPEIEKTQVRKQRRIAYEPRAIAFLGMKAAAENNIPTARTILEPALKELASSREKASVQFALGSILLGTAPDRAKALLKEAAGEPVAQEAACLLAKALMEESQWEEARGELQKALQRNGSLMCARSLSIELRGMLGEFEGAYAEAVQWAEDDAQALKAFHALSLNSTRLGKAEEGLKAAEAALLLEKANTHSLRLKAEALFGLGRAREAMDFLLQAQRKDFKEPSTLCAVGMGFFRRNNITIAHSAFLTALQHAPKSMCGTVGVWLTQPPSAKLLAELSTKAPEIKPAWDRSMALAVLANAQLSAGLLAQANQTAEKALLAAPSSGLAQWVAGKVLLQSKKEPEAALAFQRSIEFEPAWAEPHMYLADLLAKNPATAEQAAASYRNFLKYIEKEDVQAQRLAQKKLQALRQ